MIRQILIVFDLLFLYETFTSKGIKKRGKMRRQEILNACTCTWNGHIYFPMFRVHFDGGKLRISIEGEKARMNVIFMSHVL